MPVQQESGGIWGKIKSELQKPGVAAALFRSGAATMQGGLGAGLQAAAGYMDQQKSAAVQAEQTGFENQMAVLRQAVAQQQADQTGDHLVRGDTNDVLRIRETGRSNRAREGIDANGQRIQLYGIDTNASTARRGQDVSLLTNREDNVQSDRNSQRGYDASIYGTDAETFRSGRAAAGIGSKGAYTETQTTTPASPAVTPWFGAATPAVPKTIVTTRAPVGTAGDEIRYDARGNAFRRDPATGKPVPVR